MATNTLVTTGIAHADHGSHGSLFGAAKHPQCLEAGHCLGMKAQSPALMVMFHHLAIATAPMTWLSEDHSKYTTPWLGLFVGGVNMWVNRLESLQIYQFSNITKYGVAMHRTSNGLWSCQMPEARQAASIIIAHYRSILTLRPWGGSSSTHV